MDPLAEQFPGWNPYHYVHNNPINLIDPTGMSAEWISGTYDKRIDFKIDSETQKPIWISNTSEEFKEIANIMLETTIGSEALREALDSKMKIVFFLVLFFLNTVLSVAQTKDDLIIKNVIYHFICEEDQFKSHLDCNDIDDLIINNVLVVIEEIKLAEIENIKVFFFRRGVSPSRAYLLIKQKERILIIGQNKKDMFEEMKELYSFIDGSEEEKIRFFSTISKEMFFIYENNLGVKNYNRIKVNGEYID
ncbi:hypothetical protein M2391_001078 [Myroides odoratus]|nr:hypothetical protein [Myroides odoratus]